MKWIRFDEHGSINDINSQESIAFFYRWTFISPTIPTYHYPNDTTIFLSSLSSSILHVLLPPNTFTYQDKILEA